MPDPNYVAGTMDYIGRVAGLLLIGGDMDRIRNVATYVPVYMVNPKAAVVEKYEAASGVDTYSRQKGISVNFNHEFPLRTVIVRNSDKPMKNSSPRWSMPIRSAVSKKVVSTSSAS